MTRDEAKIILSGYRFGGADAADPFFAEALKLATEDGELAKWFALEQALDNAIASKLNDKSAPTGLKAALLSPVDVRANFEWTWPRALSLAAAAALITLLTTIGVVRPGRHNGDTLENYRAEMVSFVKLDPPLEVETQDLQKIESWAGDVTGTAPAAIPAGAQKLPALGCRALSFRGYKVGLVCFRRSGNGLVHMLVINRSAFGNLPLPRGRELKQEGEWMTAVWTDGDQVYLVATKGDQRQLESYL